MEIAFKSSYNYNEGDFYNKLSIDKSIRSFYLMLIENIQNQILYEHASSYIQSI